METFIVRIYRRIAGRADEPAGTVERVGTGERVGFGDSHELLQRLLAPTNAGSTGASSQAAPKELP